MYRKLFLIAAFCLMQTVNSFAWHDNTHMSVGVAIGFDMAYNLAAPDVAKLKAGSIEEYNHYSNNEGIDSVDADYVKAQIPRYNKNESSDETGHIYGAIIAAIRDYQKDTRKGKYSKYHLAYLGHYLGDLSMPLHNSAYDDFNKKHHKFNDGIIDKEVLKNIKKIKIDNYLIDSEDDIIAHVVQMANNSMRLADKMRNENRDMTPEEAYNQISQSASLFKAILNYLNYDPNN